MQTSIFHILYRKISEVVKKALEEAEDQCGEIKVTRISGLIDAKNISSALEFEFDRNVREVIILEDLVALSQHERWVSKVRLFSSLGVSEIIFNIALWSP